MAAVRHLIALRPERSLRSESAHDPITLEDSADVGMIRSIYPTVDHVARLGGSKGAVAQGYGIPTHVG